MIAIVFQPHASVPLGLLGALIVLAAGGGGLLSWLSSANIQWRSSRTWIGAAVVTALLLLTMRAAYSQVICGVCMGCDEWWLVHFWLCI